MTSLRSWARRYGAGPGGLQPRSMTRPKWSDAGSGAVGVGRALAEPTTSAVDEGVATPLGMEGEGAAVGAGIEAEHAPTVMTSAARRATHLVIGYSVAGRRGAVGRDRDADMTSGTTNVAGAGGCA